MPVPTSVRATGVAALALLFQILRQEGYRRVLTSYVPGKAGPRDFYMQLGFTETGENLPSGERLIHLAL